MDKISIYELELLVRNYKCDLLGVVNSINCKMQEE